jgi:hypothetical protein
VATPIDQASQVSDASEGDPEAATPMPIGPAPLAKMSRHALGPDVVAAHLGPPVGARPTPPPALDRLFATRRPSAPASPFDRRTLTSSVLDLRPRLSARVTAWLLLAAAVLVAVGLALIGSGSSVDDGDRAAVGDAAHAGGDAAFAGGDAAGDSAPAIGESAGAHDEDAAADGEDARADGESGGERAGAGAAPVASSPPPPLRRHGRAVAARRDRA